MGDLYNDLGVSRNATEAEIKAAHRSAVKKHHPDRGGDRTEFERVTQAVTILGDLKRRQRYDETGETRKPEDSLSQLVWSLLGQIITGIISADYDLARVDLTAALKQATAQLGAQIAENEKAYKVRENRLNEIGKRLKRKKGKTDRGPDSGAMEAVIKGVRSDLLKLRLKLDEAHGAHDRLVAIFEQYNYDFEQVMTVQVYDSTASGYGGGSTFSGGDAAANAFYQEMLKRTMGGL